MKELDYIYSDGNSLIDLDILCSSTLKIQADLMMVGNTGGCIIGHQSYSEEDSFRFFNPNEEVYLDFGSGSGYNRIEGGTLSNNIRYQLEIGNRYVKNLSTGTYFCRNSSVAPFIKSYNIQLFANDKNAKGYFYSLKIYDDNKLVFDGIPAMDDSNNIGLYDKMSHKLYENEGSGLLTYGSIVREFFEEFYLIKSDGFYYTVEGTKLEEVTELSSDIFKQYGSKDTPNSEVLMNLINPSILIWSEGEVYPHKAVLKAVPLPQTIISNDINLNDSTIKGIEKITCEYEGNPLIACSFDNEQTWKAYIDGIWGVLSEPDTGMTVDTFVKISSEKWSNILRDLDSFKIRFTLSSNEDSLSNIIIIFMN